MSKLTGFTVKFWRFIFTGDVKKTALFVFSGAFILRAYTLFIDFIHIDVVTTYVIVKRDLAGLDFNPNKGWLNHSLLKWSIKLFGDSLTSFHLTGIIFILLTMVFIFLLGKKIYSSGIGIAAAMLYGFIISSYSTEYTATNGEVLYNLFFMAAFYYFYILVSEKKIYALPLVLLSIFLGAGIKFQGIFSVIGIGGFLVLAWPFYLQKIKISPARYFGVLIPVCILLLIAILVDWFYLQIFFKDGVRAFFIPKIEYVANRGFNPFMIAGKLIIRSFHFLLYHSIIWVPGAICIIKFFKSKEKDEGAAYVVVLALMMLLTTFFGGARLSSHYFIVVLPPLSILAASEIHRWFLDGIDLKRLTVFFVLPVLFFFSWNVREALARNFFPEWKQEEGAFAYYFRIIFLSSHGEYLLPHKSIIDAIDYVNNNTPEDAQIISWPMATERVYYTGRYASDDCYWHNEAALYAIVRREKGSLKELREYQQKLILSIEQTRPFCFVDVGCTDMIRKVLIYRKKTDPPFYFDVNTAPAFRYGSFASLDDFPEVMDYLNKNFRFAGYFGKARIWIKK